MCLNYLVWGTMLIIAMSVCMEAESRKKEYWVF